MTQSRRGATAAESSPCRHPPRTRPVPSRHLISIANLKAAISQSLDEAQRRTTAVRLERMRGLNPPKSARLPIVSERVRAPTLAT
jgi:hypothetical protein